METYIGIWLDHKKAIIYSITGESETRHVIESGVQTRRRIPGEGKQYTRMGNAFIAPEHRHEERVRHQLDKYYQEISAYVQDACDLLILGPGEAKTELEKVMQSQKGLAEKVREVELWSSGDKSYGGVGWIRFNKIYVSPYYISSHFDEKIQFLMYYFT